ncbi:MAG: class I SAM-dependent methyltransferase [Leptospiraceae bacterium]|nr:class I SAM-dependent methyltransferase [Leptospiraceae bacterium]
MQLIACNSCGEKKFRSVLEKESSKAELFQVVACVNCGLVQVNPQPSFEEVEKYYSNEYFTKRTDRGYDDYYSSKIRSEIERVFQLNLNDLGFFEWEETLKSEKNTIDIGCAAGYFTAFMKGRGWNAEGIEIAKDPVQFARDVLTLNVHNDDFLNWDKEAKNQYDLVTLWASIEHLHKPKETLEKIQRHLKPKGRLILSTCRYGVLAKIFQKNWRYLNVPEHLYYYSLSGIVSLVESIGYKKIKSVTYGSGMTAKKNAGFIFKITKKFADSFVKLTNQGDMMALVFEKK